MVRLGRDAGHGHEDGEKYRAERETMSVRTRSLAIIMVCQVLALSLWFSATAVVPALRTEVGLDDAAAGLFTSAVQLGFVCGTLASALLGLADRLDGRLFFAASCLVAALANAAILGLDPHGAGLPLMRFVTGACMAGVYPVGMRLVAGWARRDLGLLVGLLTGALTLGSASPHLFLFLGALDWRIVLAASSAAAVAAAALIGFAHEGPATRRAPRLRPEKVLDIWRNRGVRYANLGYLGHMWELYAMWAWIGTFLNVAFARTMSEAAAGSLAAITTFAVIASGGLGCAVAGFLGDRIGRTLTAAGCLLVSGSAAIAIGFAFPAGPVPVIAVALVWGLTIVSDSGQFSASTAELSEPDTIGTMLTIQTSTGFLLTLVSIHLVPLVAQEIGWQHTFAFLAVGPALGILAMVRLRRLPQARVIAGGRR